MSEIIGREDELLAVYGFTGLAEGGPAALVLEGEAGIGKSTLWLAGVERAHARGLRVLSSRPAEAERGLALAGLGDLFEDVLNVVLPALPAPRRRALEGALLLEDAPAEGVDPRALGIATRTALQVLADDGPVVVAIDDVQWFDAASSSALGFALRRTAAEPRAPTARAAAGGWNPAHGTRASVPCRAPPAGVGWAPQRWSAAPVPTRAARPRFRSPDAVADPRAIRRESFLRARVGPRSRRGRRPDQAAPGSRDVKGRASAREDHQASRDHARRACRRCGAGCPLHIAARAGGSDVGRARAGLARPRRRG